MGVQVPASFYISEFSWACDLPAVPQQHVVLCVFTSLLPSVFPHLLGLITHCCTTRYHSLRAATGFGSWYHARLPAGSLGLGSPRVPGPAVRFLWRSFSYKDCGGKPLNVSAPERSLACPCFSHRCILRFCRVFRGCILQLVVCLAVFPR